jgi:competence protein ComEC
MTGEGIEVLDGKPAAPTRGRLLIARWPSLPSLADLKAEGLAQADRWSLWGPVALGAGCALYIGLRREPPWGALIAAFALSTGVAILVRRVRWGRALATLALLAALFSGGILLAKVRTARVAAPVAPAMGMAQIEGWVVDVASPGATGDRLLIAPTSIQGLAPEATPIRIRMTIRDGRLAPPGSAVRFRGLLNPPPSPAAPGAYDFARNAYFSGIGGVGVALTPLRTAELEAPPPRLRWQMAINAVRWRLAEQIVGEMSHTSRGLGAAMITGHEAWIDQTTEDRLRDAGLAHIISISGVHMAIVGGFVFFLVRTAIALLPALALRIPGKKVAAAAGLLAIGGYLVISGAPGPAIRSAITASVAFFAILVDRRAISLQALALAAFIVLLLQPEAVAEPGFQMSFAATAALVALAEAWPKRVSEINTPWPIRLVQRTGFWLWVSLCASFVAGLATGPFAIQHFNRVALFGLPVNFLSEPLSALVVMPGLALGGALEPLGLGRPFLTYAGWGLDAMNWLAGLAANSPRSVWVVASAPATALPIAFVGILWMCLWRGRIRWLGAPFALAVTLWPRPHAPVAWIASDGAAAAVRQGGEAILMRPSDKLFGAQLWANRRGLHIADEGLPIRNAHFDCGRTACRSIDLADVPRVSLWWTVRKPRAEQLDAFCSASDILVMKADVEVPESCARTLLLRPADFARGGALEIFPSARGWRLSWAQPLRGVRPWTVPGGVEQ